LFGFFGEKFFQGRVAHFAGEELLQFAVRFFGIQNKGIFALIFQGRAERILLFLLTFSFRHNIFYL
ncbi:MAG: hypothetical protein V2I97_10580, partial [Desulfococcaceae bacterium]|nr:hypothetical protein [Desulfococcaceae bacterium]